MQPFAIATTVHHPAGEFINDDHLVVFDDIVLVFGEQFVGSKRLVHVVDMTDVLWIIKARAFLDQPL